MRRSECKIGSDPRTAVLAGTTCVQLSLHASNGGAGYAAEETARRREKAAREAEDEAKAVRTETEAAKKASHQASEHLSSTVCFRFGPLCRG